MTKKLQAALKRLGLNPIPGIEEISFINASEGTIRVFKNPKLQAAIQANTFLVSGNSEVKNLKDMLSSDLGADVGKNNEDIPDLVDSNFEDVASSDNKTETQKTEHTDAAAHTHEGASTSHTHGDASASHTQGDASAAHTHGEASATHTHGDIAATHTHGDTSAHTHSTTDASHTHGTEAGAPKAAETTTQPTTLGGNS